MDPCVDSASVETISLFKNTVFKNTSFTCQIQVQRQHPFSTKLLENIFRQQECFSLPSLQQKASSQSFLQNGDSRASYGDSRASVLEKLRTRGHARLSAKQSEEKKKSKIRITWKIILVRSWKIASRTYQSKT